MNKAQKSDRLDAPRCSTVPNTPDGVAGAGASDALVRFAAAANLSVAVRFYGKRVIPDRHPNAVGTIGFISRDSEDCSFDAADAVLAVNYELQEFDPKRIYLTRSPACNSLAEGKACAPSPRCEFTDVKKHWERP